MSGGTPPKPAPPSARDHADAELLAGAQTELAELAVALEKRILRPRGPASTLRTFLRRPGRRQDKAFKRFLLDLEGPVLTALAGVMAIRRKPVFNGRIEWRGDIIRVLTNLGPTDGASHRVAGKSPDVPLSDQIIAYVERGAVLNARTRYNLACYFAPRTSSEREKAFDYLEEALQEAQSLSEWASQDPSLDPLRKADSTRFEALLSRYGGGISALGRLRVIGPQYVTRLARHGVITAGELVAKARTAGDRHALAEKLGVSERLLLRWALLADLLDQVEHLGPGEVNLLDAVGAGSIDGLRGEKGQEADLAKLLADANSTFRVLANPPALETVKAWVEGAESASPRVEKTASSRQ